MATDRYPPEARARLGRIVEEWKQRKKLSQRAVAGQPETYQNLVRGGVVQDKTLRRVEEALGWALFAANDILDGATEPRLAEPTEPRDDHAAIVRRVYEEAGQIMAGLAGATPEERQQIAEILARARARLRAQTGQNGPD